MIQGGQFDVKHFLLYYYYGGMIYTALKKYDLALYLYEVVSTDSVGQQKVMFLKYLFL